MPVQTVAPQTLHQWLAQGSAMLLDVREPGEYRSRHIAGAHNIPLGQIDAAHLPRKNGVVVIHCLKGGRCATACEKLLKQNPELKIYNLAGGIDAWAAAGLPVNKEGAQILPMDRQVQLAVGSAILAAALLAYFVNPLFVLLAAFLGTGLIVAGATGFCGLASVLAIAPWNK